jgi:4-oxalocrotonate tautomerase
MMPVPILLFFWEGIESSCCCWEQKRALVKAVTEAVIKVLGTEPERVQIDIFEMDQENMATGGKLNCDR